MSFLDGLFKPNIAKLEAKRNVRGLIKSLGHTDHNLHVPAIEALGRIGDPRAVDPLIAALSNSSSFVRAAAAEALGQIGDPRAADPLIAALTVFRGIDYGDKARQAAKRALRKFHRWSCGGRSKDGVSADRRARRGASHRLS